MTYHNIDAGLAEILDLAVDHALPKKVTGWKEHLAVGRLTDEMRDAFVALGWLSSRRDSRLQAGEPAADQPEQLKVPETTEKPSRPLKRGDTFSTGPAQAPDA